MKLTKSGLNLTGTNSKVPCNLTVAPCSSYFKIYRIGLYHQGIEVGHAPVSKPGTALPPNRWISLILFKNM